MVLRQSRATHHFPTEGRENLKDVLKVVKRAMKRREELRSLKLVFFTGYGEGPVLATNILREYGPQMIAVTFPPTFEIKRENGEKENPQITKEVSAYLAAMNVRIIRARLPFDLMEGAEAHTREMTTIKNSLSIVGGSFPLCVQAVLQACDFGFVSDGETVIGITGDCAAVIRVCPTKHFLSPQSQFFVKEFLCRAADRRWNRAPQQPEILPPKTIEGKVRADDHLLEM